MTALTEFLFPAPAERRVGAIWQWWERRRLAYNLWVGVAGAVTVSGGLILSLMPPGGAGLPPHLGGMLVPIAAFGTLANVFYSGGALVEVAAEKLFGRELLPIGPGLYRIGLTFSVGLALFPLMLMMIAWVLRAVGLVH